MADVHDSIDEARRLAAWQRAFGRRYPQIADECEMNAQKLELSARRMERSAEAAALARRSAFRLVEEVASDG